MRSLLIVPSGDAAAYAAALASGADAIVADAADSAAAPPADGAPAVYLRLPPFDAAADAIRKAASLRPRGLALFGAESGADVQRLGARLAVEEARLGLAEGSLRIVAFVTQTPAAIFGLSSYRGASARLEAMVWSADEIGAALRASPGRRAGGPFRLARDLTLIAARAAGALALDAPRAADDAAAWRAEAETAAADGFDGKAATHAAEVAAIHELFTR